MCWLCKCECGTVRLVDISNLYHGTSKSCGCLHVETTIARNTTHGESGSNEFSIWKGMMQRCHSPSSSRYAYYGRRGIAVDERWHDFEYFLLDMGRRPSKAHSIDRIDTNGNYSRENCRWATVDVQRNNTRRNRWIEYNGVKRTVAQWSRETGIHRATLYSRVKAGWGLDTLFSKPDLGRAFREKFALQRLHGCSIVSSADHTKG